VQKTHKVLKASKAPKRRKKEKKLKAQKTRNIQKEKTKSPHLHQVVQFLNPQLAQVARQRMLYLLVPQKVRVFSLHLAHHLNPPQA